MESSFRLWGSTEGDVIHPADCMHELLDQVRRHKVNIDGNVTTVMVTTLVLEVRWRILCLLGLLKWQLVSNQRWIGYNSRNVSLRQLVPVQRWLGNSPHT